MAEPPAKKGRLTLYEDLLSQESLAAMQAKDAEKQAAQQAKKAKDASLMFKPTNIGNKKTQAKPKKPPNFSAMHKFSSSTSTASAAPPADPSSDAPAALPQSGPRLTQTRGYNDWLAREDEMDWVYDRQQQEREQRKATRKKSKKNKHEQKILSWDDIYDPTVPVPIAEYKGSDAQFEIEEEWKTRLYRGKKRQLKQQGKDVDMDEGEKEDTHRPRMGKQSAGPSNMSFAPPKSLSGPSPSRRDQSDELEMDEPQATYAPPPPAADINMEETADEAYARRLALSSTPAAPAQVPPPPPSFTLPAAPSFAPASTSQPVANPRVLSAADEEKKAKVAAQIAAMRAKLGKPAAAASPSQAAPVPTPPPAAIKPQAAAQQNSGPSSAPMLPGLQHQYTAPKYDAAWLATPSEPPFTPYSSSRPASSGTISAGPTYTPQYLARQAQSTTSTPPGTVSAAPTVNTHHSAQQQDQTTGLTTAQEPQQESEERTSRPGQDGFAERHMKKLGWEKGQGLGASGEGITTALKMQAQKRKKKSDAQGGGYVAPAAMGKIVGGKKAKPKPGDDSNTQNTGSELDGMSEVVKLSGMLENMDVDQEIAENNLMQEIGDEMGEQYGKVERIYIFRRRDGGNDDVFVKFTSPLSAVRCLKGMDGTEFAENKVVATYWDAEMFERGEYTLP